MKKNNLQIKNVCLHPGLVKSDFFEKVSRSNYFASIGKNILYRLIEISLKLGEIEDAEEYFREFMEVASKDNTSYILKYKIQKAKNDPLDEQIQTLEKFKDSEFTEKWGYELAYLYYQADEKQKCMDLCSEMALWFSDSPYVLKALELKKRYGDLSESEKELYEKLKELHS